MKKWEEKLVAYCEETVADFALLRKAAKQLKDDIFKALHIKQLCKWLESKLTKYKEIEVSKKDKLYMESLRHKIRNIEQEKEWTFKAWNRQVNEMLADMKAKDDAIDSLRAEIQRLYGIIERRDTQLLKSQEHRSRMLDNAAKQDREIEKLKQRPIDIETGLPYVGKCPPMPKVKEPKKDTKTHGQVMQQLTEILATTRDCLFVGDMEGWPEGEVEELTKSGILEFKFPPIGLPSLKMWRINYMERMGTRYPAEKVEGLESIKWDGKTKLSEQSDEIEKLREDVDRLNKEVKDIVEDAASRAEKKIVETTYGSYAQGRAVFGPVDRDKTEFDRIQELIDGLKEIDEKERDRADYKRIIWLLTKHINNREITVLCESISNEIRRLQ